VDCGDSFAAGVVMQEKTFGRPTKTVRRDGRENKAKCSSKKEKEVKV
jgi:hypothetical protein